MSEIEAKGKEKPEGLVEIWCSACGELVNTVTPENAAILSDVEASTINERIAARTIHCLRTPDGLSLVCLNSLLK